MRLPTALRGGPSGLSLPRRLSINPKHKWYKSEICVNSETGANFSDAKGNIYA